MLSSSAWTPRVLAAVGACISLALVLVASLDLGDPAASMRGQLAREADAERVLAVASWAERRVAPEPVASTVGAVLAWSASQAPAAAQREPAASEANRPRTPSELLIALAVARAEAKRGDFVGARATLERSLAASRPQTSEQAMGEAGARLEALRWARDGKDLSKMQEHLAVLEGIPWNQSSGRSPRLMGLLAAADALERSERQARARGLADALARGDWNPGAPRDTFVVDERGPRLVLDAELSALARLLDQRLPLNAAGWGSEFRLDARRSAALADVLGEGPDALPMGRWELFGPDRVPGLAVGTRLAVRRDAASVQVAVHDRESLQAALVDASGAGASPWRLAVDTAPAAPAEAFGAPFAFDGAGLSPVVVHQDPAARVRAESRRLRLIRAALFVLAGLIGLSTWLAVRALRRASRLAALRSTFVASVSHDLRTPLASISNLAANLADGVVVGDHATREYNLAIQREALRLGRLVNGLLDFARIDRGERPRVQRAVVDAAVWLDQLESAAGEHCRSHGIDLRTIRADVPKTLRFDGDAVHRAVLNLVENAVRHSGSESITLRTTVAEGRLSLQVEDQGGGVPAALREDLFEPYACRGATAGTGLGLTIVRSIAEAHGGDVSLSEPAEGGGFVVRLDVPSGAGDSHGDVA